MGRGSAAGTRDALVVLLTVTTGVVDAASFLALGSVFSSVITGNLVLLGVAAGTGGATLAIHSGVALAGYAAGVAAGAPLAARHAGPHSTWPRGVTVALGAELAAGCLFSVWWELAGGHPRSSGQLALLAVLAACMGVQAAAVRQLGQMSTTYLTSTLTGVIGGLVTPGKPDALPRSLGVLAAIVVGAVIGSVVVKETPGWLPLAMLIPLAVVVAVSAAAFRGRPGEGRPGGSGVR